VILGVTPARGGSKDIVKKNIKPLCGKPLIAWTIEAAKRSRLLDEYVVSTEDAEIARVSEEEGARVVWRPEFLATDEADTLPVLQHVLKQIPADTLVLLQTTCPIRDADLIDRCIEKFFEKQADSLATGFLCKYTEYGTNDLRRQDIEGFFYDDGNVYVMKGDLVRRGDRYGKRIEKMYLDREQNVEIDDHFDFWLAEQVMKRRGVSRS